LFYPRKVGTPIDPGGVYVEHFPLPAHERIEVDVRPEAHEFLEAFIAEVFLSLVAEPVTHDVVTPYSVAG
jgi:hypothetical protein